MSNALFSGFKTLMFFFCSIKARSSLFLFWFSMKTHFFFLMRIDFFFCRWIRFNPIKYLPRFRNTLAWLLNLRCSTLIFSSYTMIVFSWRIRIMASREIKLGRVAFSGSCVTVRFEWCFDIIYTFLNILCCRFQGRTDHDLYDTSPIYRNSEIIWETDNIHIWRFDVISSDSGRLTITRRSFLFLFWF